MQLTVKGQVTIPQKLRQQYGLLPHTEVTFEATAQGVLIKPAAQTRRNRLAAWARKARGSATAGMGTAGIMRLTRDTEV